jgi:hypothetical protein
MAAATVHPLEQDILRRPYHEIWYGHPVVTARVHVTSTQHVTKEFPYFPADGYVYNDAAEAGEAAEEWVEDMHLDLGQLPAVYPPDFSEMLGFLVAVGSAVISFYTIATSL